MNCIRLFLACFITGILAQPLAGQNFDPRVYQNASGGSLSYRLLTPATPQPAKKYPLVLFLHGAGERGTNNSAQLVHGTKIYLDAAHREAYPCYVIAPQCPDEKQWVNMPWNTDRGTQPAQPSEPMQLVIELLDALPKEFSIDPDRIYVTGLSMGGYGTWDLITRLPGRFAAAPPRGEAQRRWARRSWGEVGRAVERMQSPQRLRRAPRPGPWHALSSGSPS